MRSELVVCCSRTFAELSVIEWSDSDLHATSFLELEEWHIPIGRIANVLNHALLFGRRVRKTKGSPLPTAATTKAKQL